MANYEIIKKIAVIGGKPDGVTKEINIVKWGVYDPMIDIRRWQGDTASKGISLKREEAQKLLDALKTVLEEEENEKQNARNQCQGNARRKREALPKRKILRTFPVGIFAKTGLCKELETAFREKDYRIFRLLKQLKVDCGQLEKNAIIFRVDEILKELR